MPKMDDEYALVLDGVDKMMADMAQGLLREAGIPSLLHGADFDVAELGIAAHSTIRGIGVYVPMEAFDKASEILAEAWGEVEMDATEEGEPEG